MSSTVAINQWPSPLSTTERLNKLLGEETHMRGLNESADRYYAASATEFVRRSEGWMETMTDTTRDGEIFLRSGSLPYSLIVFGIAISIYRKNFLLTQKGSVIVLVR